MLELKENKEFKNYKELCEFMGWKYYSGGNGKKSQFKELETLCKYHKKGNRIVIDEVFKEIKEKIDKRKNNHGNEKIYKQLKINQNEYNNYGVYYILNKNNKNIYIGSTISGFKNRFIQHWNGYDKHMKHTYNLLHNGGEFHISHNMTDIIDEPLIRMVENEYIDYFKNNTNYNVINCKNKALSITKKKKIKYKSLKGIKVKLCDYKKVITLLRNFGFIK